MHNSMRTVLFVLGLTLGIVGTIFLPRYVRPYMPEWVAGKASVVTGTVMAKQKKENALLVTVETPAGALVATFKKKVDEISLLVNEGDTIELTLPTYRPFIDDPMILRVVKARQAAPGPDAAAAPKEKATKDVKPRREEKTPAAAPAPGAAETKLPAPAPTTDTTATKPQGQK